MPDSSQDKQVRPFAAVLQDVARGDAHRRLSEALAELVVAVCDHDKPGSLTVVVKVEPTKGMDNLTVSVTHSTKLPAATQASIFFADGDGVLTRNDPRQPVLPFGVVARIGETA